MQLAFEKLSKRYPKFTFKAYLMDLHGDCQHVKIDYTLGKYIQHDPTEAHLFLSDIVDHHP